MLKFKILYFRYFGIKSPSMRSPYRSSLFRDKLSAGWYVLAEFRAFTCNGGTNTQGRPYTPKLYVSSFMTRHRRTLYLQFYKVSRRFDVQRVELFVDIKIPPKVPSFPVITQTTSPELFRENRLFIDRVVYVLFLLDFANISFSI